MVSYPPGTFVPIAILTHGIVGLTLGALLFDRPVVGGLAGMLPDIDFLFPTAIGWPFVHRGITHTLLFLGLLVAILVVIDRSVGGVVGVAILSHYLIDVTLPTGVPFFYPIVPERIYLDIGIGGHSPMVTIAFWVICVSLLLGTRYFNSNRFPVGQSS